MFKIQNVTGGSLSIQLETSSIILQKGNYYDLDGVCSRLWIHTDPDLQRLIQHKRIRVVQDSEITIPKLAPSTNEKVFTLLKPKEAYYAELAKNAYTPKEKKGYIDLPPKTVFPNDRQKYIKQTTELKKSAFKFPTIPSDDPIIIDLSKYIEMTTIDPIKVEDPVKPIVEASVKPIGEESVIEALPVVKIDEEDLKELFKEYPELNTKKSRRSYRKRNKDRSEELQAQSVEELKTDGSNQ